MPVAFSRVRELFELHGWRLMRVWGPFRVFWDRPGEPDKPPFLVQVDENKEVSDATYQRVQRFFGEEDGDA